MRHCMCRKLTDAGMRRVAVAVAHDTKRRAEVGNVRNAPEISRPHHVVITAPASARKISAVAGEAIIAAK